MNYCIRAWTSGWCPLPALPHDEAVSEAFGVRTGISTEAFAVKTGVPTAAFAVKTGVSACRSNLQSILVPAEAFAFELELLSTEAFAVKIGVSTEAFAVEAGVHRSICSLLQKHLQSKVSLLKHLRTKLVSQD
ncbi:hypothetical protein BaRGS_00016080 [Batillaria attramentaria]|uniref:Uncharacterized protein n=1 Tax=Batillaria attramentaria TaxID=370345 RepID=A0ABD0KZR3_9CAEN